jgi:hypothetical protein
MVTLDTVRAPRFGQHATRGDHSGGHMFKLGAQSCSNCGKALGLFFFNFVTSAGRGQRLSHTVPFGFLPGGVRGLLGLGIAAEECPGFRAPAAGAPPPGSPPRWAPVWVPAPWFPPHTRAGAGGVPAVGVGAAFWCPKWPVPLSRLFGGGLESHRNPSGWCGVGHRHVPAKCARGYPRKRPGSTPNPESGSEIGIVKASRWVGDGVVQQHAPPSTAKKGPLFCLNTY